MKLPVMYTTNFQIQDAAGELVCDLFRNKNAESDGRMIVELLNSNFNTELQKALRANNAMQGDKMRDMAFGSVSQTEVKAYLMNEKVVKGAPGTEMTEVSHEPIVNGNGTATEARIKAEDGLIHAEVLPMTVRKRKKDGRKSAEVKAKSVLRMKEWWKNRRAAKAQNM